MGNIDLVAIWEASPFLAVSVFLCVLFWVARKYPEKTSGGPQANKADDLFADNNEMFRAVLVELREIRRVLSDIHLEQIRGNSTRRN